MALVQLKRWNVSDLVPLQLMMIQIDVIKVCEIFSIIEIDPLIEAIGMCIEDLRNILKVEKEKGKNTISSAWMFSLVLSLLINS